MKIILKIKHDQKKETTNRAAKLPNHLCFVSFNKPLDFLAELNHHK